MYCETGCRRKAVTLWENEDREHDIVLCGQHSDRMAPALATDGYQQIEDTRDDALHPRLGAVTADPLSH